VLRSMRFVCVEIPARKPRGVICPSCPAPFAKIFWFSEQANHFNNPLRLVPLEGRIAIVTDAGRDAVDADGAKDERA
jgi:hypothetical protein